MSDAGATDADNMHHSQDIDAFHVIFAPAQGSSDKHLNNVHGFLPGGEKLQSPASILLEWLFNGKTITVETLRGRFGNTTRGPI